MSQTFAKALQEGQIIPNWEATGMKENAEGAALAKTTNPAVDRAHWVMC
jgi:hypothetical protein